MSVRVYTFDESNTVEYVLKSDFDKVNEKLEKAVKALEFYGRVETWLKLRFDIDGDFTEWSPRMAIVDSDYELLPYKFETGETGNWKPAGKLARSVLAEIKGGG